MRKVWCKKDYVEDDNTYWTRGNWYRAIKHRDGTWSIRTNFGSWGAVGELYMLDDFDEYFTVVPKDDGVPHHYPDLPIPIPAIPA